MKTDILNWEKETHALAIKFTHKYFGKDSDFYWIADEVGGVLQVNDYFFDLNRIVDAIKYSAAKKKLFAFYDLELDMAEKNRPMDIKFKNYLKLIN